eukprot:CAMPEP_0176437420 /NCGR_PEP_ID=MMETSP0127-20121128/18611_1 /TAXON_ID=938130 /ORGANISM="Platyophrya macrostoma, Strain WH" /LENGTH=512 /DNA_ID=CAMNT_0017821043 /DNA_START=46 /DNA_END=1584 /DNA_ORIENTATION=+
MKYITFVILALALTLTGVNAEAGLKFAITPKGMNDFTTQFVPQLLNQLMPISLPEFKVSDFNIKNGLIESMTLDGKNTQISFGQGTGNFRTTNFALKMSFFIEGSVFGFIPVHFQTGGVSRDDELTVDLGFGYEGQAVQINLRKLDLSIRNLEMHFPDDALGKVASAVMNALSGGIESVMSLVISTVLKGTFQNIINNMLAGLPAIGPLPKTPLGVEYQATQMPVINPTYLATHINGTFYNLEAGFLIPEVAPAVSTPEFDATCGKDFQVVMTEYSLNTLADAYWRTGTLFYNVTQDMVPAEAGLKLNVKWLKQFVPTLATYYPNDNWELIVNAQVTKAPVMKVVPGDFGADVGLTLTFYVNAGDNNITQAVSVNSTLSLHANFSISNWVLAPYIISGSFSPFTVLSSNVGDFNPAKFQQGLNILLMFALPGFNAAKPTFPLPAVPGMNLSSLEVNIRPGHLQVGVSPIYTTLFLQELIQNEDFTLADFAVPLEMQEHYLNFVKFDDDEFLA